MNQKSVALRNTFLVIFSIFFAVAMIGGLFWASLLYVQRTPVSFEFLPLWKGTNNLLLEGLTPYGEFTTYEIQKMVYGRAAGPSELPLRVGMPLPLLLFFMPIGAISDVELARAAWMVVLEISLILLLIFCLRLSDWQARWFELFFIFLFGFLSALSLTALIQASATLLLVALLFGALLAARASLDELAGLLISLSFFDLELSGLLILFLLAWATLTARWRIWAGLVMSLIIVSFIAYIIDPEWMTSFLLTIIINWRANADPSTFTIFTGWFPGLGQQIAWGFTFILLLLLMFESQQMIGRSSLQAFWAASLVAAVTPLVGLPVKATGLVVLLPAFLLAASILAQRWALIGRWAALSVLLIAFGASWFLSANNIESIFFWMSLLAIFILYWVRWWVVRPARLWADRVSTGVNLRVP